MDKDKKTDLELLIIIRQTLLLALNKQFLSIDSYRNAVRDIDDKIKAIQ